MEWPTSKFDPIDSMSRGVNALSSLQDLKKKTELKNALSQVMQNYHGGTPDLAPVMAVDPNAGAALQEYFTNQEEQQRLMDFRDMAGQYITARSAGHEFDATPLWQSYPNEMLTLDKSLTDAEKAHYDFQNAQITDNLTRAKAAQKVLQNVNNAEDWSRAVKLLGPSGLGMDVSGFPPYYDPAVRDALLADATGMVEGLSAMYPEEPSVSPMGKYIDDYMAKFPGSTPEDALRSYQESQKAGASTTTIDMGGDVGKKAAEASVASLKAEHERLLNTPELLSSIDEAEKLIPKAIMGSGASAALSTLKALDFLGIKTGDLKDKMNDTEYLRSILNERVLANLKKTFGAQGLTEGERQELKETMGTITTNPNAMLRLLKFYRNKAIRSVEQHNQQVDNLSKAYPDSASLLETMKVSVPETQATFESLPDPKDSQFGIGAQVKDEETGEVWTLKESAKGNRYWSWEE